MHLRFWRSSRSRAEKLAPVTNAEPSGQITKKPELVIHPVAQSPAARAARSAVPPSGVPEAEQLVAKIKMVIEVWENVQQHRLSRDRKDEFRNRPQLKPLMGFSRTELREAAVRAMASNRGRLLLSAWLSEAEGARSGRQADKSLAPVGRQVQQTEHREVKATYGADPSLYMADGALGRVDASDEEAPAVGVRPRPTATRKPLCLACGRTESSCRC